MVPEQANAEQIDARKRRAEDALRALKSGADFAQVAAGFSDASDALSGGNLGWRPGARLPTVFGDEVRAMTVGQISSITRSAAGFHIVKLLDKRSHNEPTVVDQTHARHILVRVNEIVSESDAKAKIERLKDRIDTGAKFEELAKLNPRTGLLPKAVTLAGSIRATPCGIRRGDEKLEPNQVPTGAIAFRLAPHSVARAAAAGHHRHSRAFRGASGDPPAQGGRGVSGLGAPDPRPGLRRSSAR